MHFSKIAHLHAVEFAKCMQILRSHNGVAFNWNASQRIPRSWSVQKGWINSDRFQIYSLPAKVLLAQMWKGRCYIVNENAGIEFSNWVLRQHIRKQSMYDGEKTRFTQVKISFADWHHWWQASHRDNFHELEKISVFVLTRAKKSRPAMASARELSTDCLFSCRSSHALLFRNFLWASQFWLALFCCHSPSIACSVSKSTGMYSCVELPCFHSRRGTYLSCIHPSSEVGRHPNCENR